MIKTRPGWSLIQPYTEPEQTTQVGIVVPDAPLQASMLGIATVVGSANLVVYQKTAGYTFHHKGASYLLIPDTNIIADLD
jgi:co-chaperonin GroES (HSP10)